MKLRTVVLVLVGVAVAVLTAVFGFRSPGGEHNQLAVPYRSPVSTSPTTSTTISLEEARRQLARTDVLEREQPIVRWLPHDTTHYLIDYHVAPDGSLDLTITLYGILNDAGQLAEYRAALKQYKAEALDYLRSHGADPAQYRIEYKPPEAAGM